jgi:hypothetical protein
VQIEHGKPTNAILRVPRRAIYEQRVLAGKKPGAEFGMTAEIAGERVAGRSFDRYTFFVGFTTSRWRCLVRTRQ